MDLRVHLLALPNAQTTRAYSKCGFAMATIRFAEVLRRLDAEVYLYASEENEAPCKELVTVITKEEAETLLELSKTEYQHAWIDQSSPLWQLSNPRTVREIAKRKQPRDFICQIGGASQQYVSAQHPDLMTVEYSIGYGGSFSPYRVFESVAWRHNTYGFQKIEDGRWWDTVIPCHFDPADFAFNPDPEPFALYVGRLVERKGVATACEAAKRAGVSLKLIGHGYPNLITYGEYLGALDYAERNAWMSRASVIFTPTQYIEPFCCVAAEAQLCGTPVIATDWGGFTETIMQGVTGFRCTYLGEFVDAVRQAPTLDRRAIHARAVALYSIDAVVPQYAAYFRRLSLLWNGGWYSEGVGV